MTPEHIAAIAARNEARKMAPVQGFSAGIPWEMHLRAYDVYAKKYGKQKALIEGGCRGGFGTEELDRFIPGWREELSQMKALEAEVARLTAVIEHDRSKVVDVLAEANAVIKNYGWLAEGRGSYAFDDDRWKDEFKACMDSLAKVLDPMRGIASDLSDSPIKWADIVAARSMTDALAEAEKLLKDTIRLTAAKQPTSSNSVYGYGIDEYEDD